MATTRFTPVGVIVEFDHLEITQIIRTMNTGAGGAAAFAALLTALGVTGPAAAVFSVGGALLKLGTVFLNGCNSKQIGIFLHVLYFGPFWCRSK
jgi:hypothetical protein